MPLLRRHPKGPNLITLITRGLRAAADRLIAAAATPRQCDPVRDIPGDTDIASAYAVQGLLSRRNRSHSLTRWIQGCDWRAL
jgi:hypothetical protein